jgi:Uma2 family endonuclease
MKTSKSRRLFNINEYHQLGKIGILNRRGYELLNGIVWDSRDDSGEPAPKKFTTEEYSKMGEAGILPERGVELIEGEIINTMSPIGSKHLASTNRINRFLTKLLDESAIVSVQNPVVLDETSEPEADIAILKPRDDFYENKKPEATDIFFIIEVSDSTYRYDVKVKLPMYAKAGIDEAWIINLKKKQIEIYKNVKDGLYRTKEIHLKGEEIVLMPFEKKINATQLLGE